MTGPLRISVLICTWNRPGGLESALDGLAKQTLSPSNFEVVVVDNNSTDNTREVAESLTANMPYSLRYVLETRQGKCWALNTGIDAARGEVVACLDDDCVPEPDWLVEILRGFERPEVAILGGACPSVYSDAVRADAGRLFLARRFFGGFTPYDEFTEIFDRNRPLGMNLALRKEVAEAVGAFDVRLGPRPEAHLGREETGFIRAAQEKGFRVFYTPSAVVHHHIEDKRVSLEAIRRHGYFSGRGSCRQRYPDAARLPAVRKIGPSLVYFAELFYSELRWIALIFNSRKATVAGFRAAAAMGKLAELWSQQERR